MEDANFALRRRGKERKGEEELSREETEERSTCSLFPDDHLTFLLHDSFFTAKTSLSVSTPVNKWSSSRDVFVETLFLLLLLLQYFPRVPAFEYINHGSTRSECNC